VTSVEIPAAFFHFLTPSVKQLGKACRGNKVSQSGCGGVIADGPASLGQYLELRAMLSTENPDMEIAFNGAAKLPRRNLWR